MSQPRPFKTLDDIAAAEVEALTAVLTALTREDAERFNERDPASFDFPEDIFECFADRELDGLHVMPELLRTIDEYGMGTLCCAYFTLSHPAFSGGFVWDRATATPVLRVTDLRVGDEAAFRDWIAAHPVPI